MMKPCVLLVLVGCVTSAYASEGSTPYSYDSTAADGPQNWGTLAGYATCGTGKEQSPINVQQSSAVFRAMASLGITLMNNIQTFTFQNTGKGTTAVPATPAQVTLQGGPLNGTYRISNFHMHYGNQSLGGSEHTLDGQRATGELHVVFHKSTYADATAALASGERDALAVVGILYQGDDSAAADPGLTAAFRIFSNLTFSGNEMVSGFDVSTLVTATDLSNFFTYPGSLTTPACNEQVIWLVTAQMKYVSLETVINITRLMSGPSAASPGSPTFGNNRPLQSLGGREVQRNFEVSGAGHLTAHVTGLLLSALLAIWMVHF